MKLLLIIFAWTLALSSTAQKYALIDKTFFRDIKLVDTVNTNKLNNHIFVLLTMDLDSLMSVVSKFQNLHEEGMQKVFHNPVMSNDTTSFNYSVVTAAMPYGYRYDIVLLSSGFSIKSRWRISDASLSNKVNQNAIRHLYKYLLKQRQNLQQN